MTDNETLDVSIFIAAPNVYKEVRIYTEVRVLDFLERPATFRSHRVHVCAYSTLEICLWLKI